MKIGKNDVVDNYVELYNNIWSMAVADDIKDIQDYLFETGFLKGYKVYLKNIRGIKNPIEKQDKKLDKFKEDLKSYIKMKTPDLEQRIKELVLEETKEWPLNKKNSRDKDVGFINLKKELEYKVLEFSQTRMGHIWRGL